MRRTRPRSSSRVRCRRRPRAGRAAAGEGQGTGRVAHGWCRAGWAWRPPWSHTRVRLGPLMPPPTLRRSRVSVPIKRPVLPVRPYHDAHRKARSPESAPMRQLSIRSGSILRDRYGHVADPVAPRPVKLQASRLKGSTIPSNKMRGFNAVYLSYWKRWLWKCR